MERNTYRAFRNGWAFGYQHGPASPRMAEDALAAAGLMTDDAHIVAFCNGSDDGAGLDRFRLKAVLDADARGTADDEWDKLHGGAK